MYDNNLNLLTDEELIDLVQDHNYKAFRELVARYSSDLFNFLYHFVYNNDRTKNIVQTLFLSIWREPYLYKKNTKLFLYKKIIRLSIKNRLNKNGCDFEKKIISSLKNQELLAINLYYFSTLKDKEISLMFHDINNTLNKIDKRFKIDYGVDLNNFISSLNLNIFSIFEIQKDIVRNSIGYRQKDRHQNIIILLSILPIFVLIAIILYSLFKNDNGELFIKEHNIEVFEYLFGK